MSPWDLRDLNGRLRLGHWDCIAARSIHDDAETV